MVEFSRIESSGTEVRTNTEIVDAAPVKSHDESSIRWQIERELILGGFCIQVPRGKNCVPGWRNWQTHRT